MNPTIKSNHFLDSNQNPAGGNTFGVGFAIGWQNGPLGRRSPACSLNARLGKPCDAECTRKPQNGAFVEDIIEAAIDRIEFYQTTQFKCDRNANALEYLKVGLLNLRQRTIERERNNTEGTHQI